MDLTRKWLFIIMFASFCFPLAISYGQESPSKKDKNVVLTPADQLILDAIDKVREDLSGRIDKVNDRIDKVNDRIDKLGQNLNSRIDKVREDLSNQIDRVHGRIDNLWITMLGGFLGVMAFIGGLVFWDRKTFMRRAREEMRDEVSTDRNKLEAMIVAMRKIGEQFPEVREVLRSFGLL
jgi:chaperonin cofactor prefoldin